MPQSFIPTQAPELKRKKDENKTNLVSKMMKEIAS